MKEFALKHPYLTTLLLVPVAVGGVVRLTYALLGRKTPFEQTVDSIKKLADSANKPPVTASADDAAMMFQIQDAAVALGPDKSARVQKFIDDQLHGRVPATIQTAEMLGIVARALASVDPGNKALVGVVAKA